MLYNIRTRFRYCSASVHQAASTRSPSALRYLRLQIGSGRCPATTSCYILDSTSANSKEPFRSPCSANIPQKRLSIPHSSSCLSKPSSCWSPWGYRLRPPPSSISPSSRRLTTVLKASTSLVSVALWRKQDLVKCQNSFLISWRDYPAQTYMPSTIQQRV